MRRYVCFLAIVCCSAANPSATRADESNREAKPKFTNKLAQESSPYLLQHAHNPVNWYPWGQDAFDKAKKENKLVFLSIGYSSCHWCHVMEKESFANEEVAKLMNDWFVCIKVDREERPDIDRIYMTALETLSQNGGWPLSMFLTAEGKPIVGGTYWPREDKEIGGEKARGFKTLLKIVHDYATEHPKELEEQADKLADATQHNLAGALRGIALVDLNRELIKEAVESFKEQVDPTYGGLGNPARKFAGTKFPSPPTWQLLQVEAERTKSEDLAGMVALTLDHMARGGIYDHLGGGFHRYSTERTWTVPHFEKMLYDNAQLAEIYALAFRTTKKEQYKRVLQETLGFVARELTSPDGAFYSALDADAEGEEGKFYVWTEKEIDAILTDKSDGELFKKVYGVEGPVNFESKFHILILSRSLADAAKEHKTTEDQLEAKLAPLRKRLFDVRAKRPRPFLDTKVLTAWNGEMIAGYALAGQILGEKAYVDAARKAADFILKNCRTKEGRLLRSYGARPGEKAEARLNAYLDDYAYFVHGLLNLHDATKEAKWLDESKVLTEQMIEHFGDKNGGFFYTSKDHEKLFARSKDQYDGAQPSANSVAARNLTRLWIKTSDDKYRAAAEKTFKAFAGVLKTNPTGLPAMADALGLYLDARSK
ncbi:MAG TPA: thioredoxin domain-containing protein [Gemmataceae bacterium]|nr:thioredoxin domain-containing protein [Gemmataceae bacterium]